MAFLDFFRTAKERITSRWKEFGRYTASFSRFGSDIYKSDLVRACIRPLADFTSKATAKSNEQTLERMLNKSPNMYMSGSRFLYKARTLYELHNTVFIYLSRDDRGKVTGAYPVPYASFDALEYMNGLFIRFHFANSEVKDIVLPWEDLAVLRKDYCRSDISGEDNGALIKTLELIHTADQGMANAIKATANLRGILKSTKAMLSPEAIKKQKDDFVRDYLSLENEGGIASLDATQEFTPITMQPKTADAQQKKDLREDVYRYFGVNDKIVMSDMTPEEIETFYELRIEPFLVELSAELSRKIYSGKREAYAQNYVLYEANRLQFASMEKKIAMFKEVVLYGGMTINEWRAGCNMAPVEGGDERIMRLDAAPVDTKGEDEDE